MSLEALIRSFLGSTSQNPFPQTNQSPILTSWEESLERDATQVGDYPEATLKLISQMLMEEDDPEHKPCMLQEYLALQATEKSFSDALRERGSNPKSNSMFSFNNLQNKTREKQPRTREEADSAQTARNNKQMAGHDQDSDEPLEAYDKVLLFSQMDPSGQHKGAHIGSSKEQNSKNNARGRRGCGKKEVVDLTTILTQCAQAVARGDIRSANEILGQIRRNSSPYGDGNERLAYYFANALEARLHGTGASFYSNLRAIKLSTAMILRGYRLYVKCCPFNHMPNFYANKSIVKLAEKATRIHIIDFGIMHGFQWPCLMQQLFDRNRVSPRLRITGIDYPQQGFRPEEQMEKTRSRLEDYSKRFGITFEFAAITKKWENIKLEDFRFDEGELLVVNCMHRLRRLPDETVVAANNPRDAILNLIKTINPDIFIHGVINGSYNAPFFLTRFRETLFQFSAAFDMLHTTVPSEEMDRMLFEKEVLGRDIMNIVACEGAQRVERPEAYKQWQVRTMRAGFKQLPLNQEIVKDVMSMVKLHYHKDFVVDKDGNWLLQGWKGRIMQALSCWKPLKES